ncbi:cytochrome P450 (plasmid) [Phormidium sp. CLA17]|uniref:cytochrome P450 n=1 Tax=Leptolyngbya sp. Cla-17 TaxID=2803751 RepID=UPI001490EBF2|nr:cytochrome P450 [Leptolyngbya sp. Cla-17]MBM0745297.1 cytochrome P450 [Leptolyngbya sp. Cla-17]
MVNTVPRSLNGPPKTSIWQRRLWGLRFLFQPLETIQARCRAYGDNYRVSQPDAKPALVYFSSPQALEAIFTAKPEQLSAGRGNQILKELIGERGIVLLEGAAHQRQRQLLMPPFHGDRMRSYAQVIGSITTEIIRSWKVGTTFAVRPVMQSISLQVILQAVFGLEGGERCEQLCQAMSQMLDGFGSPLGAMFLFYPFLQKDWGWSPWGRFLQRRQQVDDLLYAEIADRRNQSNLERSDILALLMAARDVEGQPMSDVELRDELITLLFAGHETTASALAWALYWIVSLPDVQTKLLSEIDAFDSDADPTAIARLPYLHAVCQETLRLYPIALSAFPRVVKQPIEIAGYPLEPGTVIMPSIYLAHHRESVYPEPKQFRPERFLERQYSPYEYLPFGGGDRRCIGAAFALFEMKLVLFKVLSRLEFSLVDSRLIRPIRRGITVAPSNHLRMKVIGIRHPVVSD